MTSPRTDLEFVRDSLHATNQSLAATSALLALSPNSDTQERHRTVTRDHIIHTARLECDARGIEGTDRDMFVAGALWEAGIA